jgi:glucuronoarabinoxylan endo-1,4-beta-xylanase
MMLRQNYPNPFNPITRIEYAIPKACYVRLRVFDMLGREVAVLVDGNAEPAWYTVSFQAQNLPSGAYLYRLEAGGLVQARKMLVLR